MTPSETTDTGIELENDTIGSDAQDTAALEADAGAVQGDERTDQEDRGTDTAKDSVPVSYRAVSEDGKRLDEKARATLDEIKAKDPALAREIRNALFEADRFRRALPGGLKEVQELRETVQKYGGPEGIEGMEHEFKGWMEFDKQYIAGDPKALEFMLDTPESQAGFLKIAPVAFNKFEELNPEGYASYLCQRIMGDAVEAKVPIAMELAQHYLAAGDTAKAAAEFSKVVGWFQGLDATAKRPVTPPKTAPTQEDPRLKELEQRDTERTRDEWRQETAKEQNQIYGSELTRLLAGRKVTDIQREDILHRVQTKLGLRIKEQEKTLDRYFAVKDKNGFLKFANSFSQKHIPELLREAVDRYLPMKPGPKTQPAPNGTPLRPPTAKPVDGFAYIQQMPTREQIDWDSPFTKIREGRAMTVDGKKVTWRKA